MLSMTDVMATPAVDTAPTTGGEAAIVTPTTTTEIISPPSTESATPVADTSSDVATPEAPAKTEGATDAPTPAENILGDNAPAEKKPDEAAKPAEATTEVKPETPIEPPVYEFNLPENVAVDQEKFGTFQKLLGEIETGKLDHAAFQEKGQALVDMALAEIETATQRQTDYYLELHKKTGDEWLKAFKADPELGGDNIVETVGQLQNTVARFGGTESQLAEFREVMKNTNAGNHPAVIRVIKNMADKLATYESEPKNGMVPAAKPAPNKVKPHELFYTRMG